MRFAISNRMWQSPDLIAFPFFENLLPEGEIRTLLAEGLKTSQNNFARLLSATGGDVAGALSMTMTPAETDISNQIDSAVPADAAPLSKSTLGEVLKCIETTPFLATPGA